MSGIFDEVRAEMYRIGFEQGLEEARVELITNMLKSCLLTTDDIARYTDEPIEVIQEIAQSLSVLIS